MNPESDGFEKVCKVDQLIENTGKRFIVDDVEVALFKIGEKVYAVSNICPHQHTALIYDGFIEDGHVICPVHGWEFNLATGRMRTGGKGLDTYPVLIVGDEVLVKVFKKKILW
ncbi:MAG: Rieske (2Fe-2S) protein [Ignavibacteriales bacterium]|nr:Rieske (2Fe-2S) protein [Ignavibacteriales bacterium]